MDSDALAEQMAKCTGMLFFGMKPSHRPMKSILHGEMFILDYLERKNGPVIPSRLSELTGGSSARTAIALRGLEKNGYIRRETDKEDRRKVLVTITDSGRQLVREKNEEIMKKMRTIAAGLGEKDTREYIRIVGRIVEIMKTF